MIVDSRGIIRKLDTKSVLDFLKQNQRPLVIYGMGENGEFVYHALKQYDIPVSALGDGSPKKQGQIIDGLEIMPWQAILERYPDALLWITIANRRISDQVADEIRAAGFKQEILIFNLKYPMSEEYYRDWDAALPTVIVGKGTDVDDLYRVLEENGCSILQIVYTSPQSKPYSCKKGFDFNTCDQWPKEANYIICDEEKWQSIINRLHEAGVYERIYRYTVGTFGRFEPRKYTFENILIRRAFFAEASRLNYIYYAIKDEVSRNLFKDICYRGFLHIKDNGLLSAGTVNLELIWRLLDTEAERNCIQPQMQWDTGRMEEDAAVFLSFLRSMSLLCERGEERLKLEKTGNIVSIMLQQVAG